MNKKTSNRNYGWLPDVPDHRDHPYAAAIIHLAKLHAKAIGAASIQDTLISNFG